MGLTRNKIKLANQYLSSCGICRNGIFCGQEYRWVTGSVTGLVHDWCVRPAPVRAT